MRTYYFISDLHIGGDEALGTCDFEQELIEFLDSLAQKCEEDVELVIVGDGFGLWEFTQVDGALKLDVRRPACCLQCSSGADVFDQA